MPRQSGAATAIPAVDGQHRGHHLAGHQTVFPGQFVDDVEAARDGVRGVDQNRGHRNTSAELEHPVTVRWAAIGETPQAAQHGGAAGVMRFPEPAYQGAMDRLAVMPDVLVGENRQLLEQVQAVGVGGRECVRTVEELPGALTDPDPLDGQERFGEEPGQFRGRRLPGRRCRPRPASPGRRRCG